MSGSNNSDVSARCRSSEMAYTAPSPGREMGCDHFVVHYTCGSPAPTCLRESAGWLTEDKGPPGTDTHTHTHTQTAFHSCFVSLCLCAAMLHFFLITVRPLYVSLSLHSLFAFL